MWWGDGGNSMELCESTKILRFSTEWAVSTRRVSTLRDESRKTRRLAIGDKRSSSRSSSFKSTFGDFFRVFLLDFLFVGCGDFLSRFLFLPFSSFGRVIFLETAWSSDFATFAISLSTFDNSQSTSYRERVSATGLWSFDSSDLRTKRENKLLLSLKTLQKNLFKKAYDLKFVFFISLKTRKRKIETYLLWNSYVDDLT